MIISSASTVKAGVDFPNWVVNVAPVLTFLSVAVILWISLRSSGAIMKLVGKGGIEAISRLMGFLLVCMGVQFLINGVLEVVRTFPLKRVRPEGRTRFSLLSTSCAHPQPDLWSRLGHCYSSPDG